VLPRAVALQQLLRGTAPSSRIYLDNWHAALARQSRIYFASYPSSNPFYGVAKGHEAAAYARFSALDRCVLLKALCELRCDRPDCRGVMELAQKSEKTQIKLQQKGKRSRALAGEEVDTYIPVCSSMCVCECDV
jgi:hypothetical protein